MRDTSSLHALDDQLLQPLFRKYAATPPPLVHYTTIETLALILANRNLRMTHFRHLNDSTEMLHGRRVVDGLLRAEADRGSVTSEFFDYCRYLFNEVDDTAIQYFVSSFSANDDSPELWAGYGAGGRGVAIVFDTTRMGADASETFPYHIARVNYTESEQLQLLAPLVYAVRKQLSAYIRRAGYDLNDPVARVAAAKLCSHLNHHSISLKERKWKVEREWRTIFSLLKNDSEERRARVKLRADGKPFIDVPVVGVEPEDGRLPIVRVRAGAATDVSAIRQVLDRFRYQDVSICRSLIAVRDLPAWPPA